VTSPFSWTCAALAIAFPILTVLPSIVLGGCLWSRLEPHTTIPKALSPLAALATASVLGYATFWFYFLHLPSGRAVSWLLVGSTVAVLLLPTERRRLRTWIAHPEVAPALVLFVGCAIVSLAFFLATAPDPLPRGWGWVHHASRRIPIPDNVLPLLVAQKLSAGQSLHTGVLADGSTARPPLQAGLVLMQLPAWELLVPFEKTAPAALYEAFGVVLQSAWLLAAWALVRALGLGRGTSALLLLALMPSPVLLLNTIYVWPKLLAAAFALGAYCLLLLRPPDAGALSLGDAAVATAFASLALLAHPAVVTTLVAFGALLLVPRWFPGWRALLPAATVALSLLGPWIVYQTWFRPLHFTLAKQFIGGGVPWDERSLGELLHAAYLERPPADIAHEKMTAAVTILGFRAPGGSGTWQRLRSAQSTGILPALGLLNVGWLFAFGDPRRRRTVLIGILALAVSVLLFFESHAMHHTSYATILLLFVGLGASVTAAPAAVALPVLGAHAILSFLVFSAVFEEPAFRVAPVTMVVALATYGALVAWALASRHDDGPAPVDERP